MQKQNLLLELAKMLKCPTSAIGDRLYNSHSERQKIEKWISLKRVRTIYKDKMGNYKEFLVHGITRQPASDINAYGNLNKKFNVSVAQHFYARHRIRLTYPFLPCAIEEIEFVGLNGLFDTMQRYYPLELLEIIEVRREDAQAAPARGKGNTTAINNSREDGNYSESGNIGQITTNPLILDKDGYVVVEGGIKKERSSEHIYDEPIFNEEKGKMEYNGEKLSEDGGENTSTATIGYPSQVSLNEFELDDERISTSEDGVEESDSGLWFLPAPPRNSRNNFAFDSPSFPFSSSSSSDEEEVGRPSTSTRRHRHHGPSKPAVGQQQDNDLQQQKSQRRQCPPPPLSKIMEDGKGKLRGCIWLKCKHDEWMKTEMVMEISKICL